MFIHDSLKFQTKHTLYTAWTSTTNGTCVSSFC